MSLNDVTHILGQFVLPLLFAFGAIGNLLIILYFSFVNTNKSNRRHRNYNNKHNITRNLRTLSSYHYLVIQLAWIDFLACVGSSIIVYHYHSYDHPWRLGGFGCKIAFPFLLHVCPLVSCWTLVLLSYERYRRITLPFRLKRVGKKEYAIASLVITVVAVLFHLPTIVQTRVVVSSSGASRNNTSGVESTLCYNGIQTFGTVNSVLYRVANRLLDCAIPAALMCYFYRRMSACMKTDGALLLANNSLNSQQRNRVALRTLKNLILVYVMCVFPGRLLVLTQLAITQFVLGAEASRQNTSLFSFVHLLLGLLYTSNNAVNVLVYARLIEGFRRFLKRLFTCGYLSCCFCDAGKSTLMIRQLRMKLIVNKRAVMDD